MQELCYTNIVEAHESVSSRSTKLFVHSRKQLDDLGAPLGSQFQTPGSKVKAVLYYRTVISVPTWNTYKILCSGDMAGHALLLPQRLMLYQGNL